MGNSIMKIENSKMERIGEYVRSHLQEWIGFTLLAGLLGVFNFF